jgi:hypothetical protein
VTVSKRRKKPKITSIKMTINGRAWWLTFVIQLLGRPRLGPSQFKAISGQKVIETPSQPTSWAWWGVSVIAATRET